MLGTDRRVLWAAAAVGIAVLGFCAPKASADPGSFGFSFGYRSDSPRCASPSVVVAPTAYASGYAAVAPVRHGDYYGYSSPVYAEPTGWASASPVVVVEPAPVVVTQPVPVCSTPVAVGPYGPVVVAPLGTCGYGGSSFYIGASWGSHHYPRYAKRTVRHHRRRAYVRRGRSRPVVSPRYFHKSSRHRPAYRATRGRSIVRHRGIRPSHRSHRSHHGHRGHRRRH